MTYKAEFTGWNHLAVEDLLVAYRKAKADCFLRILFQPQVSLLSMN